MYYFCFTFLSNIAVKFIFMRNKSNYLFHHCRHLKRRSCFECRFYDPLWYSCTLFNVTVSSGYVMKCFVPHYDIDFKPNYKQLKLFDL